MKTVSSSMTPAADMPASVEGLAPEIDPARFARQGEQLAGRTAVARMPRLLAFGLLDDSTVVEWQIAGQLGRDEMNRVRPFLQLQLRFAPVMSCGRCLGPVPLAPIDASRRFRLAATERQASLEDPEAGDDVDVIAADSRLSLAELIEDEAILALPMAVFHERCPDPASLN